MLRWPSPRQPLAREGRHEAGAVGRARGRRVSLGREAHDAAGLAECAALENRVVQAVRARAVGLHELALLQRGANERAIGEGQLAVEVQVRSAHSALQEARELAEASQKVVEQAQEALRLANVRYDAGTATQLDVLQTNVELTTARTNQIQAYYAFNVALAQLRAAMGLPDEFIAE